MDSVPALTIGDAAARLGRSKQRVHQMLREGKLEGPVVAPGRAAANVGRVWEHSVADELARRQLTKPGKRRSPRSPNSGDRVTPPVPDAVLALKVALDASRELLRDERSRSRALTRLLMNTVAELEREQMRTDKLDSVADGYSSVLTHLLTPHDAASIRPARQ